MGFQKRWDTADIISQLNRAQIELNSAYNDGYSQWGCKQDLYQIKFVLDEILKKSPNFGDIEQQWLDQQSKRQVWNVLNDKQV